MGTQLHCTAPVERQLGQLEVVHRRADYRRLENLDIMDWVKSIPTHMDFDGQARAENLSRIIVVLFGAVGLIWGYIIQRFSQTVYILGAGLVLATILTVPPWPLYRLKPLKWQKARDLDSSDTKQNPKKKK